MGKAKSKKKRQQRVKPRRRGGRAMVELKAWTPSTVQKTVRVPADILEWLEDKTQQVKPPISVPLAIVQILRREYLREQAAKAAS